MHGDRPHIAPGFLLQPVERSMTAVYVEATCAGIPVWALIVAHDDPAALRLVVRQITDTWQTLHGAPVKGTIRRIPIGFDQLSATMEHGR